MKKVVLLVPDRILHEFGSSGSTYPPEYLETSAENLRKMFSEPESYHETFRFQELGEVRVISVEDWNGKEN